MAVFPTLQVFIGFTSASTNNYLFFNDTVLGKFDTGTFATTATGTPGTWTDVSADVRSFTTTRGRQRQIEAFASGQLSMVLDNNAGNYDPDNLSSPYVVAGVSSVLPMRAIAVRAIWNNVSYDIFYGFIDDIRPMYSQGAFSDATCEIVASDAMKVLQNIKVSGGRGAEKSGARIGAILNAAGWSSTLRNLQAGDMTMQLAIFGNSAAQEIQAVTDSEYGRWYIDTAGQVVFESRSSRNKVQAAISTWSDTNAGSNNVYANVGRVIDDQLIRNQVTIQNVGGTAQTVSSAASQTQYQQRTFSSTNLLLLTNTDAYQLASALIYIFSTVKGTRFDSVLFQPTGDPTNLWPEVLGRAISDRVNVIVTPPNLTPITIPAYVEGVTHRMQTSPVQTWDVEFHASRANPTPSILFNDATFGITFATNATSPANALNTFGF